MKNTLLTLKITLIQFLLFYSFSAFGQCNISSLTAELSACEGDLFDVLLDFEYENTSDQFTVSINDVDYGTYNYADVPITVTSIESDCNTEYVFIVTDAENEECLEEVLLPNICCDEECEIIDLVLTTSECDGQVFDLTIDFDFVWGTSSTFDWEIPGLTGGSAYFWELPLTVQITNNGFDILGFVVNMTGNDNCAAETSFENPCVDNSCNIGDLVVEITECEGDEFAVIIDFEYENTSDQFTVVGNGVSYGTFSYADLPITIDGLTGDCSTEYEFVATDVNDNGCSDFYELGTVCCGGAECDLFDLVIETTECDGTEFVVTFDFQYTGTTNDFFDWEIPGVASGFAEFTDLPLSVGIDNSTDNTLNLFISENDNPNCAINGSFENPCFNPEECFIGELNIDASECDGNEFFVVINFEYENTSDEFFVNANGENYGPYSYTSLPITIQGLEGNCDVPYEFQVYDSEFNGTCESDANIGIICCESDECILSDMILETSECIDGVTTLTIDFDHQGATSDFFDWEIEGTNLGGTALLEDLPISVDVENTDLVYLVVYVNITDNEECALIGEILNPCFEGNECFIGELDVDVSECDGNFFFVVINFEYENTSDQFTVNGNGNSYGTFSYADLPITIDGIESDCDLQYEFVVHDVQNNDCASDIGIGSVCCEGDCEITTIDFGANPICENGLIITEWLITGENISEVGFDIFINDEFEVFVEYNETNWYDFDIEDPGTEYFTIKACDNDNEDCCYTWEVMNPCFEEEECDLFDLVIETSECEGGVFEVTFDFEYTGTSNNFFDWEIPGYSSGFAEFSDLPLTITMQNTNVNGFDLFINENDNPECSIEGSFENPCFDTEECFIGELDVDVSECDGNFFFVVINFEYENTSDQFTVNGNGNSYGTFSYADLPITIDGLESNCDIDYEFVVHDVENEDCASDVGIGEVCCDEEECFIGELNVEVSECDGNFFFVVINFEYENTSDQFTVNGNGNSYGTFSYADLPITIDGLESNCDIDYEFVVHDVENEDCASDVGIGEVCCDEEECFIGELNVEVSECDGNFFFVVINFEYENTSDQFTVNGNGNSYGTFSYADLPITIDGLESNCDIDYEFVVHDVENEDCASDVGIGEVCCDEEECFIGELNVEVSECDGNFFFVVINFEYENTSDQFFVNTNGGNFGPYAYTDLPITIDGLEANCESPYEILVYDSEFNGTCESEANIGIVCCDNDACFIGELDVEVSECDGSFFFVVINFEYENTSDQFTVNGNGNSYGTFSYADLPITIDGLESNCDIDYEFVVHDVENEDCASDVGIGEVCCDEEECEIVSIDFGENPICEDNFIVTEWLIIGENVSEVGFDIFINNEFYIFVEYNDSNWYDFDIENPGTEYFTIKACDNDNEDCCYTWEVMNPCYEEGECDLFDLNFDVSECDGNFFLLEVDFEYTGNTNEFFEWEIPGVGSGFEMFANLPITIEIENTTDPQFTFFANENDNPDCDIVGSFGNPCFNSEECWIEDVSAEVVLCEDDLYDVEINFEYANVGSSFSIVGNGVDYGTFEYDDLPVVLTGLSADCELEYEFEVSDNENEECSNFVEIGTICCEDFNQINNIESETIINGDIFNISFNISNTTLKGCNIDIYIDGELYVTLEDDESSFMLGPFDCDQDDVIEIKMINSCSEDEETILIDLSDIECVTNVVETLEGIDLDWNMVQKILSLEGEIPVAVDLQLINAQGALILTSKAVSIGWNKDLNNLPSGLYFVRIIEHNANTPKGLIRKIVVY